jgi:hypothetical protein
MKVVWVRLSDTMLIAKHDWPYGTWSQPDGLTDTDMTPIHVWCVEHDCGIRMSFDMFKFRDESETTAFLLRWT